MTSPIEITITINATLAYRASTLGNWIKGAIAFICGSGLAGGITWLPKWAAKRRSAAASGPKGAAGPEPKELAKPTDGP